MDRGACAVPAMGDGGGLVKRLFNELSADPDFEYILIDSTICKTHADRDGRKGGDSKLRGSDARAAV